MPAELNERYSQQRIEDLRNYLLREQRKGREKDYEASIDGFKLISRTSDIGELEGLEGQVTEDTRTVTILVYDGPTTHRNTKHNYHVKFGEVPAAPMNGLGSPPDFEALFEKRFNEMEKDREILDMRNKLGVLEEDVAEKQKTIDKYEKELEKVQRSIQENKFNLGGINIAELGSEVARIYLKGANFPNPKVKQAAQLLGALGGFGAATEMPAVDEGGEAPAATFSDAAPKNVTESQIRFIAHMELLEAVLAPEQIEMVLRVLEQIRQAPAQLPLIADLLKVK